MVFIEKQWIKNTFGFWAEIHAYHNECPHLVASLHHRDHFFKLTKLIQ
jgi:nitrite reductase/ring-hydroxylating ferredoxin subunit